MILENIRELIGEINPNAAIFDSPSFDDSIIGMSTEGKVIYDLESMIRELSEDDNITEEEAADIISYDTMRAVSYIAEDVRPIILDDDVVKYEIERLKRGDLLE